MTPWLLVPFLASSCFTASSPISPPDPLVCSANAPQPDLPVIERQAIPSRPFSVTGPRGALLGRQDGTFEAWIFPWKVLSNMRISARMEDYPIPIDVNNLAAEIDVRPDRTTITYSHANFTIRQIMLAPKEGPDDAGVLVLYQIEAIRPMTLTFSFEPRMQRMWPASSDDPPDSEWVKGSGGGTGFYILHLSFPDHAAAIALPGAEPGILLPYQEHPAALPLQLVLRFDPARDSGKLFPLLLCVGGSKLTSTKSALAQRLAALGASAPRIVESNRSYYRGLLASHASIETPDDQLNAAFQWAIVAIDQLDVKTTPDLAQQALTAGVLSSGGTTRPGFGWFFGRDGLWSLYAVNSYGDLALTRRELDFLAGYQRADGKILHERSQTAGLVDWKSLPYQWAAADATPLFLMAANDYLAISGDTEFIRHLWPNLQRAWSFETSNDSDGDGIYDNSAGTGWVESWYSGMPHQEIYLAALDQQASTAFAHLARATGHESVAVAAGARARRIAAQIQKEYYLPSLQNYAFSRNADGTTDNTATIFPSVAWWDGSFGLPRAGPMFKRWASSEFSTDWGTRDLSDRASFYDPISYHQGSVWPLFTGWASVAEYRAGNPLSAYAHLMQNANLTWAQDLGNVTELLSGQFYQMPGRSTAHQLWSSAMVISPVLRGLFGIEWDEGKHTLTVTPHLPAEWPGATVHNLPFGNSKLELTVSRSGPEIRVTAKGGPPDLHLASRTPGAKVQNGALILLAPAVEVGFDEALPPFGSVTMGMKVVEEEYQPRKLTLRLDAPGGATERMTIRQNIGSWNLDVTGGTLERGDSSLRGLLITFPSGDGYVEKVVTITWQ